MSRTHGGRPRADALANSQRVVLAGLGVGLAALLVVAFCLQPDPSGTGTHRQLGLPPCTFLSLFGQRCPACGMTTAWAHVARGEIVSALRSNIAGTFLALAAVVAFP